MLSQQPTVVELKHDFLNTQIRLLSQQRLIPSRSWRDAAADISDSTAPLSSATIDDALFRTNHILQQHCRRVYAPQATRHVAEQIDQLYWDATEPQDDNVSGLIAVGADLSNDSIISVLPKTWSEERDASKFPMEARRFTALAEQLTDLSRRRNTLRERLGRLERMRAMLEPLATTDSQHAPTLQMNLVTRNCDLEKELERMRVLLARVGGRISVLSSSHHPHNHSEALAGPDQHDNTTKTRLDRILDDF